MRVNLRVREGEEGKKNTRSVTDRCSSRVLPSRRERERDRERLNGKQHHRFTILHPHQPAPNSSGNAPSTPRLSSAVRSSPPSSSSKMSMGSDFGNPLRKFKLVFLGEQSGKTRLNSHPSRSLFSCRVSSEPVAPAPPAVGKSVNASLWSFNNTERKKNVFNGEIGVFQFKKVAAGRAGHYFNQITSMWGDTQ